MSVNADHPPALQPGLLDDLCESALAFAAHGRALLGIAGPPGAGKSTLAALLAAHVNRREGRIVACVAPLDGFHLSNEKLAALGLENVKGAPSTFDVEAYEEHLARVRAGLTVSWPDFDRERDVTVPDAIRIAAHTRIVITEGNYVLLPSGGWERVRSLLDAVWYVDAPRSVLRSRLVERQLSCGRTVDAAERHVDGSDLRNADLVAAYRDRADRVLPTW